MDFPECCADGSGFVSVGFKRGCVVEGWLEMFCVILGLACEVDVWVCGCVVVKVIGRDCKLGNSGSLLVKSCWRLLVFSLAISIQDTSEAVEVGGFS